MEVQMTISWKIKFLHKSIGFTTKENLLWCHKKHIFVIDSEIHVVHVYMDMS